MGIKNLGGRFFSLAKYMILGEKIIKSDSRLKSIMNKNNNHQIEPDRNFDKVENQREINKEIIRRLRIQNKKLIEQVTKLKEEIKKTRFNKAQVLDQINELLKLINR